MTKPKFCPDIHEGMSPTDYFTKLADNFIAWVNDEAPAVAAKAACPEAYFWLGAEADCLETNQG